jgi:NDP-sugar pyrophosphorylase family protein
MTLHVVILAGGLATRLKPITEKIPKSLVNVAGEPFIFHQLRYLKSQGIKKVTLCVGFLGNMIQSVVQDGKQFGIEVTYSFDGEKLLGTGGAIKKALPLLGKEFFILYGDSFLRIDFNKVEQAFISSTKSSLMTIIKNEDKWDKSNVLYIKKELLKYDKNNPSDDMKHIDYGLGILSREAFINHHTDISFDLSEIYEKLCKASDLQGYPVKQRFYEIGSHKGLKEFTHYIKKGE